jgi:hypothetical protein
VSTAAGAGDGAGTGTGAGAGIGVPAGGRGRRPRRGAQEGVAQVHRRPGARHLRRADASRQAGQPRAVVRGREVVEAGRAQQRPRVRVARRRVVRRHLGPRLHPAAQRRREAQQPRHRALALQPDVHPRQPLPVGARRGRAVDRVAGHPRRAVVVPQVAQRARVPPRGERGHRLELDHHPVAPDAVEPRDHARRVVERHHRLEERLLPVAGAHQVARQLERRRRPAQGAAEQAQRACGGHEIVVGAQREPIPVVALEGAAGAAARPGGGQREVVEQRRQRRAHQRLRAPHAERDARRRVARRAQPRQVVAAQVGVGEEERCRVGLLVGDRQRHREAARARHQPVQPHGGADVDRVRRREGRQLAELAEVRVAARHVHAHVDQVARLHRDPELARHPGVFSTSDSRTSFTHSSSVSPG